MSKISGILIKITTGKQDWSQTVDLVYLGVVGKEGGREFPLMVTAFEEFVPGSRQGFVLGKIPGHGTVDIGDVPDTQVRGVDFSVSDNDLEGWNDPAIDNIELSKVDYVYLRKDRGEDKHLYPVDKAGGDKFDISNVWVGLYDEGSRRVFVHDGEIGLAREFGLQFWLREA